MPTIGAFTVPGWSAAACRRRRRRVGGSGGAAAGRSVGRRRARRFARDADAVVADRVLDLAEPGFREQPGERADQLGVGHQRRRRPPTFTDPASPDSASIKLASASSASS